MPNQRPKPNLPNQGQRPNNPKQIQPPMLPNNGLLLEARLSQKLLTSRAIYMESGSLNQIFLRTSQNNFIMVIFMRISYINYAHIKIKRAVLCVSKH